MRQRVMGGWDEKRGKRGGERGGMRKGEAKDILHFYFFECQRGCIIVNASKIKQFSHPKRF